MRAFEASSGGYYDYPVVRKPVWTWEVPVYFWLGGMAGGAYLTASAAELFGDADDRRATGAGFYVAAAAALPCAPLLIADLGRPERFHHMLRIFKPLSPMNLGAWTLAGFTPMTVARAMGEAEDRLPALMSSLLKLVPKRIVELVGAIFGMVLAGYTGVLLAATNVPLWAKSRLLPAVFTASAVASGSAAVSLAAERGASEKTLRKLEAIENAGGLAELGLALAYVARSGRSARPLLQGPNAMPFWGAAIGLGGVLPILLRLAGHGGSARTRRRLGTLAAACSIVGSLALRWSIFEAGKESSQDQQASMEMSRA
ncbi:MAG TPA: NrfD/PsrC family molybdoenzyme membrane anchor subunit [Candidatus Dormibacteraeota bacterium]